MNLDHTTYLGNQFLYIYRWYIRRHGKPFLREEEANEKWREKQEEHMLEVWT